MSGPRKAKLIEVSERELQDRLANDDDDKRIDRRVDASLEVEIPLASWDALERVYTANISKGGLMFRVAPGGKLPAKVDITLKLPDGTTVTLHSEIRHVAPHADSSDIEVGVQFKQIDDDTRKIFESALSALRE